MNKIYETDSYKMECETVITGCVKTADGVYISVEDSIFFPEEGGQYADTGRISCENLEFDVLDGIIVGANTDKIKPLDEMQAGEHDKFTSGLPSGIWYKIDYTESCKSSCNNLTDITDTLVINSKIRCFLDFDKRFDRMQNHSGEHILTGTIHNDYGCNNVGFHLSDDGFVTLDLDMPLTYAQIMEEEKKANAVIYKNLPIVPSFPSKEELKNITYRSKIDIEGQVRLITIGDAKDPVDVCACCAPHVAYTGEVGIIKVISVVNWKGGVRISILCGRRALEYIDHRQDIIMGLTDLLTTNEDNLITQAGRHIEEIKELKSKYASALETDIISRIEKGDPDIARTHLVFVASDFPQGSLKNTYNALKERFSGYVGIFAGSDEEGYRYLAGSKDTDSKTLIPILGKIGAKGGGNHDMIQGRVASARSDIEALFTGLNHS